MHIALNEQLDISLLWILILQIDQSTGIKLSELLQLSLNFPFIVIASVFEKKYGDLFSVWEY